MYNDSVEVSGLIALCPVVQPLGIWDPVLKKYQMGCETQRIDQVDRIPTRIGIDTQVVHARF